VTISHDAPGHNAVESVTGGTYILERPGEYEIGGVFITGIATYNPALPPEGLRKNIIFLYDFDKYTVCDLGDLDHIPSQSQIEGMGQVDVLLIPVGGGRALNAAQAGEVISRIEPSIVVPMHYETSGGKHGLESVDQFLKEMGVTQVEEQDYLRVNTSTLAEETQIILLTPQK
jgi:L-ascorbate metabolism protein UlaG (beta-lactamase superfamily)